MISEHASRRSAVDTPRKWPPEKSEQDIANELAKLSEIVGRIVDGLLYGDFSTRRQRTVEAASEVRRIVMAKACTILGISADAKGEALVSDISRTRIPDDLEH